jgi:hypothetical protein
MAEAADLIVHLAAEAADLAAKIANICTDFRDFTPDAGRFSADTRHSRFQNRPLVI